MAWLTSLPTASVISEKTIIEKRWRHHYQIGMQYQTQETSVTVEHYKAMDYSTAHTEAAGLESNSMDASGVGTRVTAEVKRENDAGAYMIIKTTEVRESWGAWT